MKYQNITHDDMRNGDGLRVVLWVSGCEHHCPGCQNPVTWDPDDGLEFDDDAFQEIITELDKPYISGITFSGGDPMATYNRETVAYLASVIKYRCPNKTIWLYTGYRISEIPMEYLKNVDVVVDGRYVESKKDARYHWAGSTNQTVWRRKGSVFVSDTFENLGRSDDGQLPPCCGG